MFIIRDRDCASDPPELYLAETEADAQELILALFEEEFLELFNSKAQESDEEIADFWYYYTSWYKAYRDAFIYNEINVY